MASLEDLYQLFSQRFAALEARMDLQRLAPPPAAPAPPSGDAAALADSVRGMGDALAAFKHVLPAVVEAANGRAEKLLQGYAADTGARLEALAGRIEAAVAAAAAASQASLKADIEAAVAEAVKKALPGAGISGGAPGGAAAPASPAAAPASSALSSPPPHHSQQPLIILESRGRSSRGYANGSEREVPIVHTRAGGAGGATPSTSASRRASLPAQPDRGMLVGLSSPRPALARELDRVLAAGAASLESSNSVTASLAATQEQLRLVSASVEALRWELGAVASRNDAAVANLESTLSSQLEEVRLRLSSEVDKRSTEVEDFLSDRLEGVVEAVSAAAAAVRPVAPAVYSLPAAVEAPPTPAAVHPVEAPPAPAPAPAAAVAPADAAALKAAVADQLSHMQGVLGAMKLDILDGLHALATRASSFSGSAAAFDDALVSSTSSLSAMGGGLAPPASSSLLASFRVALEGIHAQLTEVRTAVDASRATAALGSASASAGDGALASVVGELASLREEVRALAPGIALPLGELAGSITRRLDAFPAAVEALVSAALAPRIDEVTGLIAKASGSVGSYPQLVGAAVQEALDGLHTKVAASVGALADEVRGATRDALTAGSRVGELVSPLVDSIATLQQGVDGLLASRSAAEALTTAVGDRVQDLLLSTAEDTKAAVKAAVVAQASASQRSLTLAMETVSASIEDATRRAAEALAQRVEDTLVAPLAAADATLSSSAALASSGLAGASPSGAASLDVLSSRSAVLQLTRDTRALLLELHKAREAWKDAAAAPLGDMTQELRGLVASVGAVAAAQEGTASAVAAYRSENEHLAGVVARLEAAVLHRGGGGSSALPSSSTPLARAAPADAHAVAAGAGSRSYSLPAAAASVSTALPAPAPEPLASSLFIPVSSPAKPPQSPRSKRGASGGAHATGGSSLSPSPTGHMYESAYASAAAAGAALVVPMPVRPAAAPPALLDPLTGSSTKPRSPRP